MAVQEAYHRLNMFEGSLRRAIEHIEDAPAPQTVRDYTNLPALEQLIRNRFVGLRDRVKSLQDAKFELEGSHATLNDRCKELEIELDRSTSLTEGWNKRIDELRDENHQLRVSIDEAQLDPDQGLMRNTAVGAKEHADAIRAMEKLYTNVVTENAALKSEVKDKNKLVTANAALSAEVHRLKTQLSSLSEERVSLKRRFTDGTTDPTADLCSLNDASPGSPAHHVRGDLITPAARVEESDDELIPRNQKRLRRQMSIELGNFDSDRRIAPVPAPCHTNRITPRFQGEDIDFYQNEQLWPDHSNMTAQSLDDSQLRPLGQGTQSPAPQTTETAQSHPSIPGSHPRMPARPNDHVLPARQRQTTRQFLVLSINNYSPHPGTRVSPLNGLPSESPFSNNTGFKARKSRLSSGLPGDGDQYETLLTYDDIRGDISNGLPAGIFEQVQVLIKGRFAFMLRYKVHSDQLNSKQLPCRPKDGVCLHQVFSRKGTTFVDNDKSRACSECQRRSRVCLILIAEEVIKVLPGGRSDADKTEENYWISECRQQSWSKKLQGIYRYSYHASEAKVYVYLRDFCV